MSDLLPARSGDPHHDPSAHLPRHQPLRRIERAFERDFLVQALRRHGGNITKAAEEIGMYRQNFQQKMRELGITSDDAAGDG